MANNIKLKELLEIEDRNANWLSKKLGCSHTLVYNWIKGIGSPGWKYRSMICRLFNVEESTIFNKE